MAKHVRALSATIINNIQPSGNTIAEAGQEAITRSTNAVQRILHYDQLPEWMKIDTYIRRGYRPQQDSFRDCFWSLFYLHNESVNIWSHLLPACFYLMSLLGLDFWTFHNGIKVPTADSAIFQMYIACIVGCLLLSATYHCTNSHSEQISRKTLKLDYFGILLSIIGTNVSATYFGLYGNFLLQGSYIIFILICSAFVFNALLRDDIDGPGAAIRRTKMFIELASTALIPPAYIWIQGMDQGLQGYACMHDVITILLYFLALFFYLTHIPERWWSHTFDICGASHQIFHVLIGASQLVFLFGLQEVMQRHCLRAGGPVAPQVSDETSLSLWIEPSVALRMGSQP